MLSLFDRLWHKDLTEEEAVKLMELGIEEVLAVHFQLNACISVSMWLIQPLLSAAILVHWF